MTGHDPQDEDHEDEWQYTEEKASPNCPMCGKPFGPSPERTIPSTCVTEGVQISRSWDGPSPERNTEKLVEALRQIEALHDEDAYEACVMAREALAEFSPTDSEKTTFKHLLDVEHRYVEHDDVVIISGAEYLRKSLLADQAEEDR